MKPWRESDQPWRELLDAAAPIDEREDGAAAARVRARLALTRRRRTRPWLLASTTLAVTAAVTLVLWLRAPDSLEAEGQAQGLTWTWVARDATSHRRAETMTLGQGVLVATASRPTRLVTPGAEVSASSARFQVMVAPGGATSITVEEGTVVVRPEGQPAMTLQAGARWSSRDMQPGDATFHHWALELETQGHPRQALTVLEALTSHENVWGELALYDAARLSLDLGDLERARGYLDRYERRAPGGGVLQHEVKTLRQKLGP